MSATLLNLFYLFIFYTTLIFTRCMFCNNWQQHLHLQIYIGVCFACFSVKSCDVSWHFRLGIPVNFSFFTYLTLSSYLVWFLLRLWNNLLSKAITNNTTTLSFNCLQRYQPASPAVNSESRAYDHVVYSIGRSLLSPTQLITNSTIFPLLKETWITNIECIFNYHYHKVYMIRIQVKGFRT